MMGLVFLKTADANILKSSEGYRVVKQKMAREDRPNYFVFVAWSPADSPRGSGALLNSVGSSAGLYSRQLGVAATGDEARALCDADVRTKLQAA